MEELALASRGTKVYGYDAFEPLVKFWQVLLEDASCLAEVVRKYQNMTSSMFYSLQKTFFTLKDRVEIAAAFFALNRSSFSGTTLSGARTATFYTKFNRKIAQLKILLWI
ncbi:hypothetical protein [Wolbachia endosymbiont (group A) of Andrena dorsata]|uniref:hypothetical protein n=1 Tax=Wolbachia endosymbiont (group A) of Andrena dorsata TaxID=2953975 RepID=UPI00222E8CA2|nr:hypothetical protein [Wolbachia endosymbiont (group A) of Andrena dorsata]